MATKQKVRDRLARKKLNELYRQLQEVDAKREELWDRYDNTTSYKKEDKIRSKIRPLDEIRLRLLYELWDAYYDFPDEVEEVNREKNWDKKLRIHYCDGELHFVIDKDDNFCYGYGCSCD